VHDKRLVLRKMTEADLALALDGLRPRAGIPAFMTRIASTPRILRSSFSPNSMALRLAASPPFATARGLEFLGLYIVKAEHRGQGFGLELWRAALTIWATA
jgi:hypothetical protein